MIRRGGAGTPEGRSGVCGAGPDSSRDWPRDTARPGAPQPSVHKQFVRDYLEEIGWNKQPPVPALREDVVGRTRDKYIEAFRRLTGQEL